MVFQAVAEYRIQVKDVKLLDMEVTIHVAGTQLPVVWKFNQQNAHLTQTEKVCVDRYRQRFILHCKNTSASFLVSCS